MYLSGLISLLEQFFFKNKLKMHLTLKGVKMHLTLVHVEATTIKNPECTPATHLIALIAQRSISEREKAKKRENMKLL